MTTGTYNFGSFISNITTSGTLFPSTEGLALGLASCVLLSVNTVSRPSQRQRYFTVNQ